MRKQEFINKRNPVLPVEYYVVSTPDMEHWTIHDEAIFRYVRSEQGYSGGDILQQEQGMLK